MIPICLLVIIVSLNMLLSWSGTQTNNASLWRKQTFNQNHVLLENCKINTKNVEKMFFIRHKTCLIST